MTSASRARHTQKSGAATISVVICIVTLSSKSTQSRRRDPSLSPPTGRMGAQAGDEDLVAADRRPSVWSFACARDDTLRRTSARRCRIPIVQSRICIHAGAPRTTDTRQRRERAGVHAAYSQKRIRALARTRRASTSAAWRAVRREEEERNAGDEQRRIETTGCPVIDGAPAKRGEKNSGPSSAPCNQRCRATPASR